METGQKSGGGRAQKTTDEELLRVLDESDEPVLSTREIANHHDIEIGQRAVAMRLADLADNQRVASKEVGTAKVWWQPEKEEEQQEDEQDINSVEKGWSYAKLFFNLTGVGVFLFALLEVFGLSLPFVRNNVILALSLFFSIAGGFFSLPFILQKIAESPGNAYSTIKTILE